MKTFAKYSILFVLCFTAAGAVSYHAVKLFTKSAEEVILPEFKGKNILYVLETLTQMGLNAKLRGTLYDDTVPTYAVISQDPVPGSTIKKGRDVILFISKGKKERIIPDLRHLPLPDAAIEIEKNDFKPAHISETWSQSVRENHVISQFPRPFALSVKGTPVALLVSRGPRPRARVMPDVTGMRLLSASERLETAGLKPGQFKTRFHADALPDSILSQSPPAGAHVMPNETIVLIVNNSQGNLEISPDTVGQLRFLKLQIEPGFRKRHLRIETDLFGSWINLYDDFYSPGQEVAFLVPVEQKSTFNIYVDDQLKDTITLDPWNPGETTGDTTWELLPLQFYPQTLQGLEMN